MIDLRTLILVSTLLTAALAAAGPQAAAEDDSTSFLLEAPYESAGWSGNAYADKETGAMMAAAAVVACREYYGCSASSSAVIGDSISLSAPAAEIRVKAVLNMIAGGWFVVGLSAGHSACAACYVQDGWGWDEQDLEISMINPSGAPVPAGDLLIQVTLYADVYSPGMSTCPYSECEALRSADAAAVLERIEGVITPITANITRNVELSPTFQSHTVPAGSHTVVYYADVTNRGSVTENVLLTLSGSRSEWTTQLNFAQVILEPGDTAIVQVHVKPGSTGSLTVTLTGRLASDPGVSHSVTMTTTATPTYNVELSPPTQSKTVAPGGTAMYEVTVTNLGAYTETVLLTLSGSRGGWTSSASLSEVWLTPYEKRTVEIQVTAGKHGSLTVNLVGELESTPGVTDSASMTTSVQK